MKKKIVVLDLDSFEIETLEGRMPGILGSILFAWSAVLKDVLLR
jgi:hypothetical protein